MPTARTLAEGIVVVDELLTSAECDALRALADAKGYEEAPVTTGAGFKMMKHVRNNDRVILDDVEQAAFLWGRLQPFAFPVEGRAPHRLNERLRFYRYRAGQKFDWHSDGYYETPDAKWRSCVTFMIYLNDGCSGGETVIQPWTKKALLDPDEALIEVKPKKGMGLQFVHHLRHTGAEVTAGEKHVVRSDVMYPLVKA